MDQGKDRERVTELADILRLLERIERFLGIEDRERVTELADILRRLQRIERVLGIEDRERVTELADILRRLQRIERVLCVSRRWIPRPSVNASPPGRGTIFEGDVLGNGGTIFEQE